MKLNRQRRSLCYILEKSKVLLTKSIGPVFSDDPWMPARNSLVMELDIAFGGVANEVVALLGLNERP
jgi:hypothetical protein